MHLADGIVTRPEVLVGLNLAGAGAVAIAVKKAALEETRAVAWSGLFAAFLLAAQAVNVPLLPGTSAHVIGATLVTLVVGPARAIVTLTAVVIVQALLLGDGGITVLGINVLDIAVLPALAVALVRRVAGPSDRGILTASVVGTVLGNVAGASLLAAVLVFGSGASPALTFPWLIGAHGLSGVAEGILTALCVRALSRRAPGLFGDSPATTGGDATRASLHTAMAWTAVAVGVATALLPFASRAPDALERLVERDAAER